MSHALLAPEETSRAERGIGGLMVLLLLTLLAIGAVTLLTIPGLA